WEGQPAAEAKGLKVTRAQANYLYQGDVEGLSSVQYLMVYREDGTGDYVGLEQVTGSVGGRSGSFVAEHRGTFDAQGVKGALRVVPGAGTGDLVGLRGEADVNLPGKETRYPMTFVYRFE
ncbi:MAG: DUF3224 domain-containing protein, partial [Anaerolineae bacterium]|nr:DUF3224 domain-containing protein [Anaerolineae bacterium]